MLNLEPSKSDLKIVIKFLSCGPFIIGTSESFIICMKYFLC